jgi:outer membrane protein TolC
MRFLVLFVFAPAISFAMDLQEYLTLVQSKNKMVQAFERQKEAADLRNVSGDIGLVPVLTAGAFYVHDKNPLGQFAMMQATESKVMDFNLGFSKKFSTGTTLGLSADAAEYENPGAGSTANLNFRKFGTGSLGASISQSLWRDLFGAGIQLRRDQQSFSSSAEKIRYDLQSKLILINAEQAYWNYLLTIESIKISRDSLERAKRIEAWTRRRVSDGISEKADLLQTQALVAARQLLLISSEDELAAAKQVLRDFLELEKGASLPEMSGNVSNSRTLKSMIQSLRPDKGLPQIEGSKVMLLEAYVSKIDVQTRKLAADQVEDAYKPDLVLSGAFQTHALDQSMPAAFGNSTSVDRPTAKIALNLTYMFDDEVKLAARSSVKKDAMAATLISERKMLESESSWTELNRRNTELSQQIAMADQIMKIQEERAKAETDLFNKGRTVTNSVVNAEEDAGTAKLNLVRLKTLQRKMEAQGRLFVVVE